MAGKGVAAAARSNEYDERVAALGERAVHTDLRLIDWTPLLSSQHKAAAATLSGSLSLSISLALGFSVFVAPAGGAREWARQTSTRYYQAFHCCRPRARALFAPPRRRSLARVYRRARVYSAAFTPERERGADRSRISQVSAARDQDMFTFTLYLGNGGIRTMQRAQKKEKAAGEERRAGSRKKGRF